MTNCSSVDEEIGRLFVTTVSMCVVIHCRIISVMSLDFSCTMREALFTTQYNHCASMFVIHTSIDANEDRHFKFCFPPQINLHALSSVDSNSFAIQFKARR